MVSAEFSLQGKVAIVAGEGRFWGKYAALAMADAGADVAIAARRSGDVAGVVAEVQRLGRRAVAIPADVTRPAQVQRMVDQACAGLGKIDILVNCADVEFAKPLVQMTPQEWNKVMQANLTPAFLCCQIVGKHMLAQGKGRIINIISCLAERGMAHEAAYCAAMGGVLQLTRSLSQEWARNGITVNAIGAGWFSEQEKTGRPGEEQLLRYLPLKRYGHPKEIGSLVVYLASDATDFVTGQFLGVDGAVMAHA